MFTVSSRPVSTRRSSRVATRIRVGICAWADPALIESQAFYPRKSMTAEARLRFYAGVFDVVEVNSSYYAIPDIRNTVRWIERTPPSFLFHVKAYSLLTGHHPRPETLPADVTALLPRRPRHTRRGEIDASSFPPEAIDRSFALMGSGYFNGKIYLVGGYTTGSVDPSFGQVWEYDPVLNTWNTSRMSMWPIATSIVVTAPGFPRP